MELPSPKAPWLHQLREQKVPSPTRGADIHQVERSELTKRGAFFMSPLPTVTS
jgi:hypothetical protein